jgi:hypothetical protein
MRRGRHVSRFIIEPELHSAPMNVAPRTNPTIEMMAAQMMRMPPNSFLNTNCGGMKFSGWNQSRCGPWHFISASDPALARQSALYRSKFCTSCSYAASASAFALATTAGVGLWWVSANPVVTVPRMSTPITSIQMVMRRFINRRRSAFIRLMTGRPLPSRCRRRIGAVPVPARCR